MGKAENDLTNAALQWLGFKGIFAWRNNSGGGFLPGKNRPHFVKFGLKGSSDILGVLPGGRILAAESKGPKTRVRPEQQTFIDSVNEAGGLAFVFRTLDELIEQVEVDFQRRTT